MRYVIDPEQSAVHVLARSSLHPFRGAAPVSGHVDADFCDGRLDVGKPHGGLLHVEVDDLRGDVPHLDKELRNRLDSQRYPTVTAVLTEVRESADRGYQMSGELTLHGRTQRVVGRASLALDARGRLRLRGTLTLDIRDFGLTPPKLLMLKVHPEVEVHLGLVAVAPAGTTP